MRRVTDERDQAQARLFIMQQIIDNTKDKEEDVAELFRDEIEELKENLERKEYLLQVNEQKYSEYEKLLAQVAEYDDSVRRRLEDINAVPRDRKITNVVLENSSLKQQMEELRYENERLRDQLEQAASQTPTNQTEELSIFQAKGTSPMPKQVDLGRLQRPGESQGDYLKKLEQTVQYLNEKIQKSRIDMKGLKKDLQNMRDSNENHVFINDKLNQALKKSSARVEELERKLAEAGRTSVAPVIVLQEEKEFGDMSSIMIAPDQIYNNFNLLEDEEAAETVQKKPKQKH